MKLCPNKPVEFQLSKNIDPLIFHSTTYFSNEIVMEEFKIYFVLCTGYYCPLGSSQPLSCSLGQYCGTNELSSPTGNCSAGYFCNGTASVPNPRECDMGYYCPEGTTVQIPCSPGTFSSKSLDIHGLKTYHYAICDHFCILLPIFRSYWKHQWFLLHALHCG